MANSRPTVLFDIDDTLVDSALAHFGDSPIVTRR
jgi:FMN phosphatase YigB (HAD superfamily)